VVAEDHVRETRETGTAEATRRDDATEDENDFY
jgi:hypothetical protein